MYTVIGSPKTRAFRVMWMLEELGVPYENVKINTTGDSRTPEFLRINPNGHVPVLQEDGLTLCESLAINLYLARKYDKGLWPKTIEEEGRAFQWSLWAVTEIEDPILTALRHRLLLPEDQRDPKQAEAAAQKFTGPLKVLNDALSGNAYLVGEAFSVADLNVAGVMLLAKAAKFDIASAPNVQAWMERCTTRPALAKAQKA